MRRKNRKARKYAKGMRKDMPVAEVILWQYLRRKLMRGYAFRRQHPIGPFITDFACINANLIVEIDGGTHGEQDERDYDKRRTHYLEQQGWTVIRFENEDIYEGLPDVLDTIDRYLPE
ncbi:MAG: DUF559 domain-containing protein [Robiginitomaculum sp.]|nr:DUF559 domain-containing protein [Robiginitomaculum sp.]